MTTSCCSATLHTHCFSREMKKKCSFFTLCMCPLLARLCKCTPCSIFLGANRCCSSQEPTEWLQKPCPSVPDKGGDFHETETESKATGNQNSILAREEAKQKADVSAPA